MATTTPLPSRSPEEKNNPGQEEYEKLFGDKYDSDEYARRQQTPAGDPSDPRGDGEPGRQQLKQQEEAPENSGGSFYREPSARRPGRGRYSLRGYINRRRAIYGGGLLGTIIALLMFFTFSSGPLTFVHIAQLEQRLHFSHQQDASNDRMGRIYRFARSGGKVGETRLGWLGSKMHANILSDLESIGLKPVYNSLDIYQGFEVDRSAKGSPFKDMSNAEVTEALKNQGVKVSDIQFSGRKVNISVKGYINQRRSLNFLTDQVGDSNIAQALRVRVMSKYGLVTWHPLKILDKKLNSKLAALYDNWKTARDERLKTGVEADTVNAGGAEIDENGTKSAIPGENTKLPSDKVKSVLKSVSDSKSFKVTGGVAFAVGLVCTAKTVNDNIDVVRYYQVITPLIRIGMDAVTTGNQIMTGQDVDTTTVSFLAKSLHELDKEGNIVSSWNQAAPIQAAEGQTGGIDIDAPDSNQPDQQGIKDEIKGGKPSWLSWTDNGFMSGLCSGVGQAVTGVVSFTVGILSGGTVSTVAGAVGGYLAGPLVIDKLTNLLAGEAVNVAATGAQWGNDVDYGSKLAANSMALQFGGTALSNSQSLALDEQENAKSQAEFDSKNIAYKLFDPYDGRTLAGKLIDNSSSSFTQNLNKTAGMFLNVGKDFSRWSSLFSPKAHADPKPFDYGFPEYGFSQQDLDNPAVADPFANADDAAQILDSPSGPSYVDKASKCFGVSIQKIANDDGTPRWDVIPADSPVNPYDTNPQNYPPDCVKPANLDPTDWLKIRFFILDTGTMEGYACYKGDEQSCSNDGYGDSSTGSSSSSDNSTASLSAQQAAQQILSNKNINLTVYDSSVLKDVQAAAAGQPGTAGAMTSAAVLQLIAAVGQSHTVGISAIQSSGQGHCDGKPKSICPGDPHYTGDAVDFTTLDGKSLTGRDPASITVIDLTENMLPSGSGYGQSQCGITPPLPAGITTFTDTCNHLHVQVPKGTP